MNLEERPLHELQINQMRPDELKKYIQLKKRVAKNLRRAANFSLTKAKKAEAEIKRRPMSKTYKPGIYWGHTAYASYDRWVEGNEELVIVDQDGFPWMWSGGEWWRFGKSMNDTSSRIWELITKF